MKVAGRMIKDMARAMKDSVVVMYIWESMKMEKSKAKECTHGLMVKNTMEIGWMDKNMDMEFGVIKMAIPILASGHRIWLMGMVFMSGRTVIDTRVSGSIL